MHTFDYVTEYFVIDSDRNLSMDVIVSLVMSSIKRARQTTDYNQFLKDSGMTMVPVAPSSSPSRNYKEEFKGQQELEIVFQLMGEYGFKKVGTSIPSAIFKSMVGEDVDYLLIFENSEGKQTQYMVLHGNNYNGPLSEDHYEDVVATIRVMCLTPLEKEQMKDSLGNLGMNIQLSN